MKGDWFATEEAALGDVLDEIDRLDFPNPVTLADALRKLSVKESVALALQAVHAITRSVDKAELAGRLRVLIDRSIERFSGAGSVELLGLWIYAAQYGMGEYLPTDPGMVRFVRESMELFSHLHSLHQQACDLHGKGGPAAAISAMEEQLVRTICRFAGVAPSPGDGDEKVAPELSLQADVLEFLIEFEQDVATGVHSSDDDPVRKVVQRSTISLCAEYDERVVLDLWRQWQAPRAKELLERGLIKRFGRGPVLEGFLADCRRRAESAQ